MKTNSDSTLPDSDLTWISPDQARTALEEGRGEGVKVAILDSGIDTRHPALKDAAISDCVAVVETDHGTDIEEDKAGDLFGHGTAVAYRIHQVAPFAELGSFKIFESREGGKAALLHSAVEAAIDMGYQIINCSFGTAARSVIFKSFKSWIDAAYINDVHIVTACNNNNYSRPEWPAHFPSVIAVNMGNIEQDALYYRPGYMVEFFAKGERIKVPWLENEWKTVTGSSYAAPYVSGLVARLLSYYPNLSSPLVKAMLREVAEPWDSTIAGDNVWD